MDINEYSKLALRTANGKDELLHAVMGLADEAGELIGPMKKQIFYGKPIDRQNFLEEAGDMAWFLNLLIHSLGSTWDEVLNMNIAKLEKRYPDLRFNADQAINRDKVAESEAMKSATL